MVRITNRIYGGRGICLVKRIVTAVFFYKEKYVPLLAYGRDELQGIFERVMPEIKGVEEGMEDNSSEWQRLNELFLRVVK